MTAGCVRRIELFRHDAFEVHLAGRLQDRIAAGRRFYNGNVRALNTRVEAFPSSLVASTFSFAKAEYFEVDEPDARKPVTVDFS